MTLFHLLIYITFTFFLYFRALHLLGHISLRAAHPRALYLLVSSTPPRAGLPARTHIFLCIFLCTSAVTLHCVRLRSVFLFYIFYLPRLIVTVVTYQRT
jgi:hypothetical protein